MIVSAKDDDGRKVSLEVEEGSPTCTLRISDPEDDDGVCESLYVTLLKYEMADFLRVAHARLISRNYASNQ